jgi:serine/threonine protein kinase
MIEHAATHYCSRCLTSFAQDLSHCPNLGCRRDRPSDGWGQLIQDGEVFDRNYAIVRKLAMGGAGVTYLAKELDRDGQPGGPDLAIKVLLAHRDHGPYLKRLATEAGILRELDHPNIVQCLGFVHRAGHTPYLVTKFESGGSLLDHLRRSGRLSVRTSAHIGRQICWALAVAHARDIVHRDLKPENVLLASVVPAGEDPIVRVADFGIAKVEGSLGSGLTRMGAFVGTPQYAAPEQFASDKPTAATDVYAVGAILYFCIMARPVVQYADRLSLEDSLELLLENLPPSVERPDENVEDVRRMNAILEAVMSPEPRARPSIEELDNQLATLLGGRDPQIARHAPPRVDPPVQGEEIQSPVVATQTSRYESEEELKKLKLPRPAPPPRPLSDGGMATGPTEAASLTLDPQRTRTLEREPPGLVRRLASVLAIALAVVAIASGAFLLGIGVMYVAEARGPADAKEADPPVETPPPIEPLPPVETSVETPPPPIETPPSEPPPHVVAGPDAFADPDRKDITELTDTDAIVLRKSLRAQVATIWPGLAKACGVPAGDQQLALALADTGAIEGAKLQPATGAQNSCVATALGTIRLRLGEDGAGKLALRMPVTTP